MQSRLGVLAGVAHEYRRGGVAVPHEVHHLLPRQSEAIRASRISADWCIKAVEKCWSQKERNIAPRERDEVKKAYAFATERYRRILAESEKD